MDEDKIILAYRGCWDGSVYKNGEEVLVFTSLRSISFEEFLDDVHKTVRADRRIYDYVLHCLITTEDCGAVKSPIRSVRDLRRVARIFKTPKIFVTVKPKQHHGMDAPFFHGSQSFSQPSQPSQPGIHNMTQDSFVHLMASQGAYGNPFAYGSPIPAGCNFPTGYGVNYMHYPVMYPPAPYIHDPRPTAAPLSAPCGARLNPAPIGDQPRPNSAPVGDQPRPTSAPVVNHPRPNSAPVVNHPRPNSTSVVNHPRPNSTPVVNHPRPNSTTAVNHPRPKSASVVNRPRPNSASVVNRPKPNSASVVNCPKPNSARPNSTPVVNRPRPNSATGVNHPRPNSASIVNHPKPNSARPNSTPVVNHPWPNLAPVVNHPKPNLASVVNQSRPSSTPVVNPFVPSAKADVPQVEDHNCDDDDELDKQKIDESENNTDTLDDDDDGDDESIDDDGWEDDDSLMKLLIKSRQASWPKTKKVPSAGEACSQSHQPVCSRCFESGHKHTNCTANLLPTLAPAPDSASTSNKVTQPLHRKRSRPRRCGNCREVGHTRRFCPTRPIDSSEEEG